jgi:hypothetical protein
MPGRICHSSRPPVLHWSGSIIMATIRSSMLLRMAKGLPCSSPTTLSSIDTSSHYYNPPDFSHQSTAQTPYAPISAAASALNANPAHTSTAPQAAANKSAPHANPSTTSRATASPASKATPSSTVSAHSPATCFRPSASPSRITGGALVVLIGYTLTLQGRCRPTKPNCLSETMDGRCTNCVLGTYLLDGNCLR